MLNSPSSCDISVETHYTSLVPVGTRRKQTTFEEARTLLLNACDFPLTGLNEIENNNMQKYNHTLGRLSDVFTACKEQADTCSLVVLKLVTSDHRL